MCVWQVPAAVAVSGGDADTRGGSGDAATAWLPQRPVRELLPTPRPPPLPRIHHTLQVRRPCVYSVLQKVATTLTGT